MQARRDLAQERGLRCFERLPQNASLKADPLVFTTTGHVSLQPLVNRVRLGLGQSTIFDFLRDNGYPGRHLILA